MKRTLGSSLMSLFEELGEREELDALTHKKISANNAKLPRFKRPKVTRGEDRDVLNGLERK